MKKKKNVVEQKSQVSIVEEISSSSSSSSSAISSSTETVRISIESDKNLYDYLLASTTYQLYDIDEIERDSDEVDSVSSETIRVMENMNIEIEPEPDFFEVLGTVPDLSEVSLDISEEIFFERKKSVRVPQDATGHFVNPVTGEDEPSKESTPPAPSEEKIEVVKEESSSFNIQTLYIKLPEIPIDPKARRKVTEDDEDELELFFEPVKERETIIIDYEAIAREEAARELRIYITQLLTTVANAAVTKAEYIDRRTILNIALDKVELIKLLEQKLAILNEENAINRFLHVKCYTHFHQKGMTRYIKQEKKLSRKKIKKYHDKLKFIDKLVYQKRTLTKLLEDKLFETLEILQESEERVQNEYNSLEELVLQTLAKGKSENFTKFLQDQLAVIKSDLKELAALRTKFILLQHAAIVIKNRLDKINDIGGQITIDDLDVLKAKIQTLDKKLETMGTELQVLQRHFNKIQHSRAHLSEKIRIQEIAIEKKQSVLDKIIDQREALKEEVNELSEEHIGIVKEIEQVMETSGILFKPLLLDDYDVTTAKLDKVKANKLESGIKQTEILNKIVEMEEKCKKPDKYYFI